jgi:DNA-binding SARP family transcriptional activator
MALQMNLLGDFRLVYKGQLVTHLESGRLQELLAYLVLHRHAPQSRQYLSFLFWPNSSEKQAHTNLRQLLHHLCKALPDAESFIYSDRKSIRWRSDASFALDVADFEEAVIIAQKAKKKGELDKEEEALHRAAELYHGELLLNCYSNWIAPERERIDQEFLLVLVELIQLLEQRHE